MKLRYFSSFVVYFFLCLIFFTLIRLFLFWFDYQDTQSYDNHYIPDESFLSLDIESWKEVPFFRFHRDTSKSWVNWEDDIESWKKEEEISDIDWTDSQKVHDDTQESSFIYVFPPEYYDQVSQWYLLDAISSYLKIPSIKRSIQNLSILLFPEDTHTRWRMFRERIYLYSLDRIPRSEVFSVFIHEFWHYYDIYWLTPTRFWNLSERFYEISWQDTDIIRAWQWVSDFVSWYAMTNMYEDFAESYTYFVLHNSAFREKKQQNPVLAQKYEFFETYAFPDQEFFRRNFSTDSRILPYYWDITKIEIDVEKFLQYIYLYL